MALTPGTRLGPYTVNAHLGSGGMGEVYQATDTNLKREVALKVLPASVAADAGRLARFQREAEVLAALNHPNIAAIYGLEKSPSTSSGQAGVTALVMELVEGPTLAELIAGSGLSAPDSGRAQRDGGPGPKPMAPSPKPDRAHTQGLPIEEALPIARQIAEALEAAHEQGIIHRDLKPANIKVRGDGTVKVLDFGLAKALAPAGSNKDPAYENLTQSPTITSPAHLRQGYGAAGTEAGMILGTAAYMAPEQARGVAVDKRADLWSFGVVLFEMLTGTRLFEGATVSDTLASVLKTEPDWSALAPYTPLTIRKLLRRCLEKDRKRRLDSAAAARLDIEEALTAPPRGADELATPDALSLKPIVGRRHMLPAAAVAALTAAVAALATWALMRPTPETLPPEMRVEITTPATDAPLQFALSPDGRSLVFVASGDGTSRLWLRPLDQTEARPLAGTEGAAAPFWSPDSRSIGFVAFGKLLRLDVAGGAPQVLVNANAGSGLSGSWSAGGMILFARPTTGLWRVEATGGEPVAVTRIDPSRPLGHRHPQFLPDGQHFLFYAQGTPEAAGIYLGSLDGGAPTRLTAADSGAGFLPPDRVVFVRQGTLVAYRLDLARAALTGDPVTLADRVGVDGGARGGFAVSGAGTVAYRAGGSASLQLTWFDRTGKAVGVAGEPDTNEPRTPELSPDGRRVAMPRAVQANVDIWLLDLVRGGMTRLTFDTAADVNPIWSPDGMRIVFASSRTGVHDLYLKPSNGSGAEERLVTSPNTKQPQDWSADGRWLTYYEVNPTTGRDLWALDMTSPNRPSTRSAASGSTSSGRREPVEGHTPRVVANTPAEEVLAQFSPDGRWVAYQTNESGRFEVLVQPFPDAGGKWQVSTTGGVAPRWRADGKELYYLAPDATLMAVPVTAAGALFDAGTPVALFPTRIVDGGTVTQNRPQYAVARDGRFLVNQPVGDATAAPITLILNWHPPANK